MWWSSDAHFPGEETIVRCELPSYSPPFVSVLDIPKQDPEVQRAWPFLLETGKVFAGWSGLQKAMELSLQAGPGATSSGTAGEPSGEEPEVRWVCGMQNGPHTVMLALEQLLWTLKFKS